MSLPAPWVDKIFLKLTLVYGRDFIARWEGLDLAEVKADWAHELDGFDAWPESIAHALKSLPPGKPPTVLEFRELARKAPRRPLMELPAPQADPVRVAQELAKLAAPAPAYNPCTDWIRRGMARITGGQPVSEGVRKCIEDAARIKGVEA